MIAVVGEIDAAAFDKVVEKLDGGVRRRTVLDDRIVQRCYSPRQQSFHDGVNGGVCVDASLETRLLELFDRARASYRVDRGRHELAHRFVAMARSPRRCPECAEGVRYFPDLGGDVGDDQLVCPRCDGMFGFAGVFSDAPVVHLHPFLGRLADEPICYDPLLGSFELGRRGRNLLLRFSGPSSHHARFERDGDRVVLRDLQSTNRTYLNDAPIASDQPVPLSSGDLVIIGDLRLVVEILDRG